MTSKLTLLILPEHVDLSAVGLRQRKSFRVGSDCTSIDANAAGAAVVTIAGTGKLHILPSGAIALEPEGPSEPAKAVK